MNCWPGLDAYLGADLECWVPASQGNTSTGHLHSSHLLRSEYTGVLSPTSLMWRQCSGTLSLFSQLFKSQSQGLGNKVLFSYPTGEGNTKTLTPQTLAEVWTAISSAFAGWPVSLCLDCLINQASSIRALPPSCLTPSLAFSLAWSWTKPAHAHWNSTDHWLLPAHREVKLHDKGVFLCVYMCMTERKLVGNTMWLICSKYLKKCPETSIMYFERSRLHCVAWGQITDLASALFKTVGVVSKRVLWFRSICHSRAVCAPLELV